MADYKKRSQPKILEAFAQLWGTDDLIASFDGINITLPINEETGRTDIQPTGAWPRKRPPRSIHSNHAGRTNPEIKTWTRTPASTTASSSTRA